jgi:Raf kinase inhibitor-like YbhB/YbcL family protein
MTMAFEINIPAFANKGIIPTEYTCDGIGLSPEIQWSGAPEKTRSFVFVCDDPDAPAGVWDHWVITNIPTHVTGIAKGKKPQGIEGINSWGKMGWGGPCPPDKEHRYLFRIYALDMLLEDKPMTKKEAEIAMRGHVLAQAEWMGRYNRPRNQK